MKVISYVCLLSNQLHNKCARWKLRDVQSLTGWLILLVKHGQFMLAVFKHSFFFSLWLYTKILFFKTYNLKKRIEKEKQKQIHFTNWFDDKSTKIQQILVSGFLVQTQNNTLDVRRRRRLRNLFLWIYLNFTVEIHLQLNHSLDFTSFQFSF